MNQITTKKCFNKFSGLNYYIIEVDGESLEDIVLKKRNEIPHGLVPTLLNWLSDREEREVVWSRVLPEGSEKTNLPILMCSEDVDLWCHLIIVQVSSDDEYVYWEKFGLELFGNGEQFFDSPEQIGQNIDWFPEVKPMKFPIQDYRNVMQSFRRYLRVNGKHVYL